MFRTSAKHIVSHVHVRSTRSNQTTKSKNVKLLALRGIFRTSAKHDLAVVLVHRGSFGSVDIECDVARPA
jgi:hypothetical protein